MHATITPLKQGIEGLFVKESRFNTTLITFNFYLPLARDSVAGFSLLPFLLTTSCHQYPDFSKLNYKLNKLYGAELTASAEKVGDLQLLKIAISVINDRYALDGEPLTQQACDLLLGMIFDPLTENNAFLTDEVEREKRKAIEHIRGDLNEKRIYARNQLIEKMFADDVYGTPKCGTEQQVAALTGEKLFDLWKQMLSQSFVRINVVSAKLPEGLFEKIAQRFETVHRTSITDCMKHKPVAPAATVQTITETMDVTQGKLCMGFRSEISGTDEITVPLLVMGDIFGGGPYSKLFANVREKMSLCYYCSASAVRIKGLLTVDSGVELKNADRAQKEILNQLESLKKGDFSDFEFESSKKSIIDSLKASGDSQLAIDTWYSVKISNQTLLSPEQMAEMVAAVTREEVIQAANGIQLHTVYRLLPKED